LQETNLKQGNHQAACEKEISGEQTFLQVAGTKSWARKPSGTIQEHFFLCFPQLSDKPFYISSGEIGAHILTYSTILYPLRGINSLPQSFIMALSQIMIVKE